MNKIQNIFHLTSNKEVLCINNIYTFLCKDIINKNFIITEKEISIIFNYLDNSNNFEIESNNIWGSSSIQKEIFEATIFFINTTKTLNYNSLKKKYFYF